MRLLQARRNEVHEVVECVNELLGAEPNRAIAPPAEARAVAVHIIAHRLQSRVPPVLPCVERRVDVDQGNRLVLDLEQDIEVVGQHNAIGWR